MVFGCLLVLDVGGVTRRIRRVNQRVFQGTVIHETHSGHGIVYKGNLKTRLRERGEGRRERKDVRGENGERK